MAKAQPSEDSNTDQKAQKVLPWEVTGVSTSTVATPPTAHRVSQRRFAKERHVLVKTGFSYLSRGDFYQNPGVSAEVSWYPLEYLAIDFLSATVFFSQLRKTAAALRESTGLLPDSQKPIARVTVGGRFAFVYGKMLVELLETILHFDLSVGLHLGALITDRAPNFGGDLDLSFQVLAYGRLLAWTQLAWWGSYERRSRSSFDSGLLGTFGVGLKL